VFCAKKAAENIEEGEQRIIAKINPKKLTYHLVQFSLFLKKICTFFSIVCLLCMKLLIDNKSPHNRQQPLWIILIVDDRWILDQFINKRRARAPCSSLTLNKSAGVLNLIVSLHYLRKFFYNRQVTQNSL
jgi:hypothetical protein